MSVRATPPRPPLLEARGLTMRYGNAPAVAGVEFKIYAGEMVALLGPNGAGKSTTLRLLAGLLRPTQGAALVHGLDIARQPLRARRHIGYLPESVGGCDRLTCAEFLRYAAEVRGISAAGPAERWIMEVLDLGGCMQTPLSRLSKGWRRRVWLAQALLHNPDILILDEPTDGLDPAQKQEIRALLAALAVGRAVIMSTHILEEAEATCRRAIIICRGRIAADSDLSALTDEQGRLFPMYQRLTAAA